MFTAAAAATLGIRMAYLSALASATVRSKMAMNDVSLEQDCSNLNGAELIRWHLEGVVAENAEVRDLARLKGPDLVMQPELPGRVDGVARKKQVAG